MEWGRVAVAAASRNCCNRKPFRAFLGMALMLHPDTPAKCCSYCGGRDHDFEECPKRKADAEKEKVARVKPPLASKDVLARP